MILTQRRRHRLIWLVLAFLLPILFVMTVLWLPEEAQQEKLFQAEEKINIQDVKVQ